MSWYDERPLNASAHRALRYDLAAPLPPEMSASPRWLINRLGQQFSVTVRNTLDEQFGIGGRHDAVLLVLDFYEGPLSQLEVSALVRLDPSSLVSVLDDLEALGLVERRVDESDRRRHALVINESGREMLQRSRKLIDDHDEWVFGVLTAEEQAELVALLQRVALRTGLLRSGNVS